MQAHGAGPREAFPWWQRGIIYEVCTPSFMDGDGDGLGDIAGLLERLDYLEWLGVDAVWLTPIYPSPRRDFGYDVANYRDIDPLFGDLDAFDALVAAVHARGIKLIMDLVANHSSDRHPWFVESRASRSSPKRDWYVWHDAAPDGGPPNNWLSVFGGSAWEWDEATGQYYYHLFLKEQPDLSWRSPAVREEMLAVLRFWLDRGVDGFRLDAIWRLIKDARLRDDPPNPDYDPAGPPFARLLPRFTGDRPEIHAILEEMRDVADRYDHRVLIGEIHLPVDRLMAYYGVDRPTLHLPANLSLLAIPWTTRDVAAVVARYDAALPEGAWPNWVLGNHDTSRMASRIGLKQARVAAMLLLTLRGTPTLYAGDELGLADVPVVPGKVRDTPEMRLPGYGLGRDPARSPMCWDVSRHAGFTVGEPWLPLAANASEVCVEVQRDDPLSMLTLHRRLLALRRSEAALVGGAWSLVAQQGDLFAYQRRDAETTLIVALNFGSDPIVVRAPDPRLTGRLLISTHLDRDDEVVREEIALRPDEGVVVAVD